MGRPRIRVSIQVTIVTGVFALAGCFSDLKKRDAAVEHADSSNRDSTESTDLAEGKVRPDSQSDNSGDSRLSALDTSADGASGAGDLPVDKGSTSEVDAPRGQQDASAPGTICSAGNECSSGVCLDGICCSGPCSGCYACANLLTGAADGTCAAVLSGKNPHGTCKDETATNQCGNDGMCDGKGACRNMGTNRECRPASCGADGKIFTPAVTCDGDGKCPLPAPQDCQGALCSTTSGCLKNCTTSDQCGQGYFCNTAKKTCAPKNKNGTPAGSTEECSSGVIADGVCCDKPCTGCLACTLALNFQAGGAQDGQCLPVLVGKPAPRSACTASATAPCGQDGTCDGAGNCHYPALGTTCADSSCSGSTLTTSACDSSHACVPKSAPCGNSLACENTTTCKSSCAKDQDCASGYCVAGSCQATRKVGDACDVAAECPNGYCVDGYCCNDKCNGECQSCKQIPGQCKVSSTPRSSCPGTGTCGKQYCDGTHTSCVFPGSTTPCPSSCNNDWSAVMSSACDGTGSCGAPSVVNCPSGQYCSTSSNQCTSKIINNTTNCSKDIQCSTAKCCGTCVNPATDSNNCGSCGNKCGANRSCAGGGCVCTGFTFPSSCGSGCGTWSFESGPGSTEDWSLMMNAWDYDQVNGATNVVISSNRPSGYPGTGNYSLVVPAAIAAAGTAYTAEVGTVFCQNSTLLVGGYSISGYVYFDGPTFPQYAVLAAYTWAGTDSSTTAQCILMSNAGTQTIANKTWLPFSKTINSSYASNRLSLQLAPNGPWTGTVYFDDIKVTGL